jgi:hypothetical protein
MGVETELSTRAAYYRSVPRGCNVNHRLLRSIQIKIPIVEMTADCQPKACNPVKSYSDCRPLPASYMSEHSVLGLYVDKLGQTIRTLSGNGFHVTREEFGAELDIGNSALIPEIIAMLLGAGIYCSTGDVIDSVYQG